MQDINKRIKIAIDAIDHRYPCISQFESLNLYEDEHEDDVKNIKEQYACVPNRIISLRKLINITHICLEQALEHPLFEKEFDVYSSKLNLILMELANLMANE